jgi:hypothetical protein
LAIQKVKDNRGREALSEMNFESGRQKMTEIIVTKWNWERVKDGVLTRLELYTEEQLRNLYGDEYERMSVRLHIEEMDGHDQRRTQRKDHEGV